MIDIRKVLELIKRRPEEKAFPRSKRPLALLIDADNSAPKHMAGVVAHASTLGSPIIRRLYGNFLGQGMGKWSGPARALNIEASQHFPVTHGKNATDVALVIDAMDILHSGRIEGLCVVSSDSDLTRLAVRALESGIDYYGYGNSHTLESYRVMCTSFLTVSELQGMRNRVLEDTSGSARKTPKDAAERLALALVKLGGLRGPVPIAVLGQHLIDEDGSFRPTLYGSKTLTSLIRAQDFLEVTGYPPTAAVQFRSHGDAPGHEGDATVD